MSKATEYTDPEMTYTLSRNESVSEAIITAVSEFSDIEPIPESAEDGTPGESLEPLYHAIDPDALDSLIERSAPGQPIEVHFQYMGYNIVVTGDGEIAISRPEIEF